MKFNLQTSKLNLGKFSNVYLNPYQEFVVKIKACKGTMNKTTEKSAIDKDQIRRFVVFLRHFPVLRSTNRVSPFPMIPCLGY